MGIVIYDQSVIFLNKYLEFKITYVENEEGIGNFVQLVKRDEMEIVEGDKGRSDIA